MNTIDVNQNLAALLNQAVAQMKETEGVGNVKFAATDTGLTVTFTDANGKTVIQAMPELDPPEDGYELADVQALLGKLDDIAASFDLKGEELEKFKSAASLLIKSYVSELSGYAGPSSDSSNILNNIYMLVALLAECAKVQREAAHQSKESANAQAIASIMGQAETVRSNARMAMGTAFATIGLQLIATVATTWIQNSSQHDANLVEKACGTDTFKSMSENTSLEGNFHDANLAVDRFGAKLVGGEDKQIVGQMTGFKENGELVDIPADMQADLRQIDAHQAHIDALEGVQPLQKATRESMELNGLDPNSPADRATFKAKMEGEIKGFEEAKPLVPEEKKAEGLPFLDSRIEARRQMIADIDAPELPSATEKAMTDAGLDPAKPEDRTAFVAQLKGKVAELEGKLEARNPVLAKAVKLDKAAKELQANPGDQTKVEAFNKARDEYRAAVDQKFEGFKTAFENARDDYLSLKEDYREMSGIKHPFKTHAAAKGLDAAYSGVMESKKAMAFAAAVRTREFSKSVAGQSLTSAALQKESKAAARANFEGAQVELKGNPLYAKYTDKASEMATIRQVMDPLLRGAGEAAQAGIRGLDAAGKEQEAEAKKADMAAESANVMLQDARELAEKVRQMFDMIQQSELEFERKNMA